MHPSARLLATAATVSATALGSAVVAASADAVVRDCNTRAFDTTIISSARNMSCAQARRTLRRHRGSISRTFSVGSYRCQRTSGGPYGGQWRCVYAARDRAFRFEFWD